MTEDYRFLELAALELIRQEGLRVLKGPPTTDDAPSWVPGWETWDQVLVGEGVGVQPSLMAFRSARGLDLEAMKSLYGELIQRLAGRGLSASGGGLNTGISVTAVFYFDAVEPNVGRKVGRIVPDRYYTGLKPQVWAVDLAKGKLWGPRTLGLFPTRAQAAVRRALTALKEPGSSTGLDLVSAERVAASQREQFVTRIRGSQPVVTYALLFACLAVFALEWNYRSGHIDDKTLLLFGALQPIRIEHQHEYWLLLTAMFVHVNVTHILFNSVALYSIGTLVERIYGHIRYAIIYFGSGIVASLASFGYMVIADENYQIAAGASGAIFGIAGVVIVMGVLRQSIVPRAVALQLSIFMAVLIVLNIAIDVVSPEIDYRAHIGGLIAGLILGYALAPRQAAVDTTSLQPGAGV